MLLDSLDLQQITMVVGDWGGPIGLAYALRNPERIRNLVITNTWLWSVSEDWYYRLFSGFVGGPPGRWLIRHNNFFVATMMPSLYGDKTRLTPGIHRHYLEPLARPEERKGCWVLPGQIIGASEWLQELWDRRGALQEKRILIAWGMKDIAFRKKELETWIRAFPNAYVVRFGDCGHFVSEEKTAELMDEIRKLLEKVNP